MRLGRKEMLRQQFQLARKLFSLALYTNIGRRNGICGQVEFPS